MYNEYINRGNYWYEGSAADQPEEYWRDISICNWLKLWVEHVKPLAHIQMQTDPEDAITRLRRGGTLNG